MDLSIEVNSKFDPFDVDELVNAINKITKYEGINFINKGETLLSVGFNYETSVIDRNKPLFKACESGNETIVKYLFEHGKFDINKKNKLGDTPLIN